MKKKPSKFTFKTTQPTGRWRSFEEPYHEIKLNKKHCGHFYRNDEWDYKIRLMVVDNESTCGWKGITPPPD